MYIENLNRKLIRGRGTKRKIGIRRKGGQKVVDGRRK